MSVYKKKCGNQFTHSRNKIKKKEQRPYKRKIITEEREGPDAKIQVLHLETMAEDEFTNATEGMDEIHSSNNDQETCEAKVFTKHFNVSKCREDVGLMQRAVDNAEHGMEMDCC